MNNIGFGIFCFGERYYYKGALEKIKEILKKYNFTETLKCYKLGQIVPICSNFIATLKLSFLVLYT